MFKKPKIAIIGGGIFGVSAARELAQFAAVTLFERRNDIFGEATRANQNRHHHGYHYHQSDETVEQCRAAKADFESVWGAGILNGFPSYFAIAKQSLKLTPEAFKLFCRKHDLPYEEAWPSADLLNRSEIAACFKTSEPVYDYALLKSLAKKELGLCGADLRLCHEVIGGKITNGEKIFTISGAGVNYTEAFDYAINVTYANFNVFCNWLGFPRQAIDFRLKELLLIRIPGLSPVGITVMDNFITLLPANRQSIFTLGDVVKSMHTSKSSLGGMPWTEKEMAQLQSHRRGLIEGDIHFIPIFSKAEFLESIWTVLPVKPRPDNADNRLTEVINHGQGCWSVFGGKIITSVTAAKQIAKNIRNSF